MSKRTFDEIQLYTESSSTTSTKEIIYSQHFDQRNLRLIELPKHVLQYIENGGHLEIKGKDDGKDTVVCTDSMTFDIKKVENSNTLYLVSPSNDYKSPFVIEGASTAFYELNLANPRIHQIKDILKSTEYSTPENESLILKNSTQLLTLEQLLGSVQASRQEVMSVLPSLGVTEINGNVRMISRASFRDVVRTLLDTILEHNWNLDHVNERDCLLANPGLDPVLLRALLGQLGAISTGTVASSSSNASCIWELNYDRLARAAAEDMFIEHASSSRQEVWPCDDFLSYWSTRVPGARQPSESLLRGLALVEETRTGLKVRVYRYFPREKLATDIKIRFQELFAIRSSWKEIDIEPFLEGFYGGTGQPKSLTELLLSHTKKVDDNYQLK